MGSGGGGGSRSLHCCSSPIQEAQGGGSCFPGCITPIQAGTQVDLNEPTLLYVPTFYAAHVAC